MDKERIVKKIKTLSTLSMLMGLLTVFCATMTMNGGWSIVTVLIPAVPAMIFNGMARTYRNALKEDKSYGDPTAEDEEK